MASSTLIFDVIAHDRASSSFDRMGNSADRSGGKLSRLGGRLKSVAKLGAIAAGVAVVYAAKMGVDAVKAAAADEKAQTTLAGALRRNAGARSSDIAKVEDWISAVGRATGVADDDLRPALGRLVTATHDVAKAQNLARIAMDVSAGTGKSLQSVSEALMKAQNGQISGLSRMGIKTKDASGATLSFKDVVKQLNQQFGGAAAANADTYQGKMDRLKLTWEETKEELGAKLIPALDKFGGWLLDKGLPALEDFSGAFKGKFGKTIQDAWGWIKNDLVPAVQDMWGSIKGGVKEAMPALKDAWEGIKPVLKKAGEILVDYVFPALGKIFKVAIPLLAKGLRNSVEAWQAFGRAAKWMWNNALQPVLKITITGIGRLMQMWSLMLKALGKVPGFEWAEEAGRKMEGAARDALNLAEKIRKIPNRKDITIQYHYKGLRADGGTGSTRGRDDDLSGSGSGGNPNAVRVAPRTSGTGTSPRMSSRSAGGDGDLMGQVVDLLRIIAANSGKDAGGMAFQRTGGI